MISDINSPVDIGYQQTMNNIKAVILAAGESTRMGSSLTKLVHRFGRKALVEFPFFACRSAGIDEILVVVGHQSEKIRSILGGSCRYVLQGKRLGTGDALRVCIPILQNFRGELLVLPGDTPFVSGSVIKKLIEFHQKKGSAATILTAELSDPFSYGRIVRDSEGKVAGIIEEKDATGEQLRIKEVNSSVYLFNTPKLLSVLPKIKNNNKKGEYYLTDAIELLAKENWPVEAMKTSDSRVILGINTPTDLQRAKKILKSAY